MRLTPLRYPGGKAQYIPLMDQFSNSIKNYDRYIEPFAGGAAIALHFAIHRNTHVVINDKDPAIYAFWKCVIDTPKDFIHRIQKTEINLEQWRTCKEVILQPSDQNFLDLGFAAFFLNRCNFSGSLKAGPIGGIKQQGKWRMDARFNKENLVNRICRIAKHKSKIEVSNLDAADLISQTTKSDIIYLDPPYYKQGKKLYNDYLTDGGHERLAHSLHRTKSPWLMSYDSCDYIKQLYADLEVQPRHVRYSFLKKRKDAELLISSENYTAS